MFKTAYLFLFFLVFLLSSCANNNNDNSNVEEKIIESPDDEQVNQTVEPDLPEDQKSEIFKVEKKSVIFFIISKKEAQNIAKEVGEGYQWETDALFTSFINQSKTFIDILKKHNINSALCNNKQFEIKLKNGKVFNFDRIKEDQILGEILTNGEKQPLISYGMYTNTELAELIQNFFGIESLGYFPPDSLDVELHENSVDSGLITKPTH